MVADVASSKEVVTKADFQTGLAKQESFIKEAIAKQEARLTWRMVGIGIAIIGIIKYL